MRKFLPNDETAPTIEPQEDGRPLPSPLAGAAGNGLNPADMAGQDKCVVHRSIEYWYYCDDESPLRD